MIWAPTRFPGYLVSRCGHVRGPGGRHHKPTVLVPHKNHKGYLRIKIRVSAGVYKNYPVHKLVAESFLGKRPAKHQVNHRDLCKTNNRVKNLEYVTCRQNVLHYLRFKKGTK